MDFITKKEKLANLIEEYIENKDSNQLLSYCRELIVDFDFKSRELFINILNDLINFLSELSRKELKQRALLIRTYQE